jgi:hypothetical protein
MANPGAPKYRGGYVIEAFPHSHPSVGELPNSWTDQQAAPTAKLVQEAAAARHRGTWNLVLPRLRPL